MVFVDFDKEVQELHICSGVTTTLSVFGSSAVLPNVLTSAALVASIESIPWAGHITASYVGAVASAAFECAGSSNTYRVTFES